MCVVRFGVPGRWSTCPWSTCPHATRPPALYARTPAHTRDLAALLIGRQQDRAGANDGFHEAVAIMGALV